MGYKMGYYQAIGVPRFGGPHHPLPLAVDLDGAMFRQPVAYAILRSGLRDNFAATLATLAQQRGNRVFTAWLLALRFPTMPVTLELNPDIEDLLRLQDRFGSSVALITGMRREIALGLRRVLDLPDTVACLGAEGSDTLSAARKARLLIGYYGAHRFAYAGRGNPNAAASSSRRCFLVGANQSSKRSGDTVGASVVALSRTVAWRRMTLRAAQLVGTIDPVKDLSVSATVSQAIWDREPFGEPAIAAEPFTEFKGPKIKSRRRRQT